MIQKFSCVFVASSLWDCSGGGGTRVGASATIKEVLFGSFGIESTEPRGSSSATAMSYSNGTMPKYFNYDTTMSRPYTFMDYMHAVWVRDFLRRRVQHYSYVSVTDLRLLECIELHVFRATITGEARSDIMDMFDDELVANDALENTLLREVKRRTFHHLYGRFIHTNYISKEQLVMLVQFIRKKEWNHDKSDIPRTMALDEYVLMYLQGEKYPPIINYSEAFARFEENYDRNSEKSVMKLGRLKKMRCAKRVCRSIAPAKLLIYIAHSENMDDTYESLRFFFEHKYETAKPHLNNFFDQYHRHLTVPEAVEVAFFRLRMEMGLYVNRKEEVFVESIENRFVYDTFRDHPSTLTNCCMALSQRLSTQQKARRDRYFQRYERLKISNREMDKKTETFSWVTEEPDIHGTGKLNRNVQRALVCWGPEFNFLGEEDDDSVRTDYSTDEVDSEMEEENPASKGTECMKETEELWVEDERTNQSSRKSTSPAHVEQQTNNKTQTPISTDPPTTHVETQTCASAVSSTCRVETQTSMGPSTSRTPNNTGQPTCKTTTSRVTETTTTPSTPPSPKQTSTNNHTPQPNKPILTSYQSETGPLLMLATTSLGKKRAACTDTSAGVVSTKRPTNEKLNLIVL